MAMPICLKFCRQIALLADSRADDNAGMVKAIKRPIIDMTTSSSMSVNPKRLPPGLARPVGNHILRMLSHGIELSSFYPAMPRLVLSLPEFFERQTGRFPKNRHFPHIGELILVDIIKYGSTQLWRKSRVAHRCQSTVKIRDL